MTKSTYPTKYQLEHLKKRINSEIDPSNRSVRG